MIVVAPFAGNGCRMILIGNLSPIRLEIRTARHSATFVQATFVQLTTAGADCQYPTTRPLDIPPSVEWPAARPATQPGPPGRAANESSSSR
jgi:hypothetical protein